MNKKKKIIKNMNSLIALISNDLRHRWTLFLAGREKKPNSGKSKQAIKVEISEWKGGRKNDSVLAAVPFKYFVAIIGEENIH